MIMGYEQEKIKDLSSAAHEYQKSYYRLKKERDDLAAELGRVKAEHRWAVEFLQGLGVVCKSKNGDLSAYHSDNETMSWIGEDSEEMDPVDLSERFIAEMSEPYNRASEELHSIKSRLPVNRDGDVVLNGDTVWIWQLDKPVPIEVSDIRKSDGEWVTNEGFIAIVIKYTFSTAESCRAANEKGE